MVAGDALVAGVYVGGGLAVGEHGETDGVVEEVGGCAGEAATRRG